MNGYIYKITNSINGKSYIGQTQKTIEERWKEHIKDSQKKMVRHRPLYSAINKHGIENFSIEQIEECPKEILSQREIYWIEYYHTYSNGYNATLGGEGTCLYNYEEILDLLKQEIPTIEISEKIGCCLDLVRSIAKKENVEIPSPCNKEVYQFDKSNNYIQSFKSCADAAKWCVENGFAKTLSSGVRSHISDVCNGKRKSAYTFLWSYNK